MKGLCYVLLGSLVILLLAALRQSRPDAAASNHACLQHRERVRGLHYYA